MRNGAEKEDKVGTWPGEEEGGRRWTAIAASGMRPLQGHGGAVYITCAAARTEAGRRPVQAPPGDALRFATPATQKPKGHLEMRTAAAGSWTTLTRYPKNCSRMRTGPKTMGHRRMWHAGPTLMKSQKDIVVFPHLLPLEFVLARSLS